MVLWHAFDGFLKEKFHEIVADFNAQSDACHILPVYQGNYREVLEKGMQAYQEGEARPHILHVYEVGTLSMMLRPDLFKPVGDLIEEREINRYLRSVKAFYSDLNGEMLSFPWNISTGVLFYNKEAFKKAGLDPECPPKTWVELEKVGEKLVQHGFQGFTTAWPVSYHLEQFSCWHNLPFATNGNGFEGIDTRFVFNSPKHVYHLEKIVEWQGKGIFSYSGRYNEEPEEKFTSGQCAMLLHGANRFSLLKAKAPFSIGVGYIPFWPQMVRHPYTLSIGGASFWVFQGFSDEEYRGIGQFFTYLSSAKVQAKWHQQTGYLPLTYEAYSLTQQANFYEGNPAAEIAVLEVIHNPHTKYSVGVRVGNYTAIREVIAEYLEKIFQGRLSPQEGLDQAVMEGNKQLRDFQDSHLKKNSHDRL